MHETEIKSLYGPKIITAIGFEIVGKDLEMINLLRKGNDVALFVIGDIEGELHAQDSASQLLSVHCLRKPDYQTKALRKHPNDMQGIVSQFRAMFPLLIEVKSVDGAVWRLGVEHSYHASNLETPSDFSLVLDFKVIDQQLI